MANAMLEQKDAANRFSQLAIQDQPTNGIPDDELIGEFVHPSMVRHKGVMINFINHNCPDSATVIGGIRMRTGEIARVPTLLSRHYQSIKVQASHLLQKHLHRCQSTLGVTESITVDDFSLSFMLASVSEAGRRLHPSGRNEGPLHFCLFAGLVELVPLGYEEDGGRLDCYVINAYIHLLDAPRRRTAALKKIEDEKKKKVEIAKKQETVFSPSGPKKPKFQQTFQQMPPWKNVQPAAQDLGDIKQSINSLTRKVDKLNLPVSYPALPESIPVPWPPADNAPSMPEDL